MVKHRLFDVLYAPVRTGRTLSYLKRRQLFALIRHRLVRPAQRIPVTVPAEWESLDAGAVNTLAALGPVDTADAIARRVDAFRDGRQDMLGHNLPWVDVLSGRADRSALFDYHFHYHDILAEAMWTARQSDDSVLYGLTADALLAWLEVWSAGGSPAWDAYPVSVRLVNWLRILGWTGSGPMEPLRSRILRLHADHVELLSRRLEWHLLGNHLLRNAAALLIGTHCWEGSRPSQLRKPARRLFFEQLLAQVGTDGVHEERSTMYHVRALRDALEVLAVLKQTRVPDAVRERVRSMAEAVPWLSRSDGSLFLLNDSAPDHGVDVQRLLDMAGQVAGAQFDEPRGVRVFSQASLVVAVDPTSGSRLLVDAGGPAPAHQPAHAHAGALGMDFDLVHTPLLVDTGCSGYDGDPFRAFFRGSRAHNTIVIDGRDQSEMWSTFRVARRAHVTLLAVDGPAHDLTIRGVCSPYHDRAAEHHRLIRMQPRRLTVHDRVTGGGGKRVDVLWHFHPAWTVTRDSQDLLLRHESGREATMHVRGADEIALHYGDDHAELGWYAAGFGCVIPIWSLRATVRVNDGREVTTVITAER